MTRLAGTTPTIHMPLLLWYGTEYCTSMSRLLSQLPLVAGQTLFIVIAVLGYSGRRVPDDP